MPQSPAARGRGTRGRPKREIARTCRAGDRRRSFLDPEELPLLIDFEKHIVAGRRVDQVEAAERQAEPTHERPALFFDSMRQGDPLHRHPVPRHPPIALARVNGLGVQLGRDDPSADHGYRSS